MKSIRIQNLRSLADTGEIELRPITLLVGQNSSGKSTFLRFFPLLRQSTEVPTTGPILWVGRFVDFGSFQEALNRLCECTQITLQMSFIVPPDIEQTRPYTRHYSKNIQNTEMRLTLTLEAGNKIEDTNIKRVELAVGEHIILVEATPDGKIEKFFVNFFDLTSSSENFRLVQRNGLIPSLVEEIPADKMDKVTFQQNGMSIPYFAELLIERIRKFVHANTSIERMASLVESLGIGSSQTMLNALQNSAYAPESLLRSISHWTPDHEEFRTIRDLTIAKTFPSLLQLTGSYLRECANSITYIAPIRATAERYYRLQGLAVGEVDFQGQNMAMFLRNMSSNDQKRLKNWMLTHFGFAPEIHSTGGHISIEITEVDSTNRYNLADMGFGFSQILPIATQLWVLGHQRSAIQRRLRQTPITFAIEQPELHLHPFMQAKFADAIVATIKAAKEAKIDLRLIIETHSQTIINRLGHLVARGQADPKTLGIVIFEKPSPESSTIVSTGEYDEEGFLVNWPFGFFEAAAMPS